MRAQPHRDRAGILERRRLRLADAALRPDDDSHHRPSARLGQARPSDRRRRRLVEDEHRSPGQRRLAHPSGESARGAQLPHLRYTGAAGLLGGLAGGRLPPGPPLGGLRAPPHRHAPLRLPGHYRLDPDLGGGLDGLLVAAPLGQGLHQGQAQWRRRLGNALDHPHRQAVPVPGLANRGRRLAHQPRPGAVDQVHPLPGPQPSHRHGVAGLGACQGQRLAGAGRVRAAGGLERVGSQDEDGGAHPVSLWPRRNR